jgi:hypothetical protein
MKHYLLSLLLLLLLLGCRKQEEQPATHTGNWLMVNTKWEYYDVSNTKVHEETEPAAIKTLEISKQVLKFNNYDGIQEFPYQVEVVDQKRYLAVSGDNLNFKFEIRSLTDNQMTLVGEASDIRYYSKGGAPVAAYKSLQYLEFVRQ